MATIDLLMLEDLSHEVEDLRQGSWNFNSVGGTVRRLRRVALAGFGLLLCAGIPAARAVGRIPDPTVPAARETEPVVLQGSSFGTWAAPAEQTAKLPDTNGAQCIGGNDEKCTHNQYEQPEVATGDALGQGVPVDRMLGYRWDS